MKLIYPLFVRQLLVISTVVLAVVMTSCSKKEYPHNLTLIPKESSLVACIDMEALVKKGDMKELKNSATFAAFKQDMLGSQPALKAILDDPSKSGIDFKQAFLFLAGKRTVGVTFAIRHKSDFEDMLKELGKQENVTLTIQSVSGCNYLAMPQNDSTAVVWDGDKALVVANTPKEEAIRIFTTKPEAAIVTDKDFASFYKAKKEIALWTKNDSLSSSLGGLLQNPAMGMEASLMKGTYTHVNMEFLDGKVVVTSEVTPLETAQKLYAQYVDTHPDDALLNYFPEQSLMLGRVSLNWPVIVEYLSKNKEFDGLITPDIRKIVQTLGGDFVCSLSGFADAGMPLPQMAVAVTVKDKSLYNLILNQWLGSGQKKEVGGYTAVTLQMYTFYVAQQGNILMLANSEEVIKSFAAGKKLSSSLYTSNKFKALKGNPGYFYLNLDLDSYPASLTGLLDAYGGGSGSKFKSALFFKDLEITYDARKVSGIATLRLKDTQKNSLAVILKKVDELAAAK